MTKRSGLAKLSDVITFQVNTVESKDMRIGLSTHLPTSGKLWLGFPGVSKTRPTQIRQSPLKRTKLVQGRLSVSLWSSISADIWHAHILNTRPYRMDYHRLFGRFIDHYPYFGLYSNEDCDELKPRWPIPLRYTTSIGTAGPRQRMTNRVRTKKVGKDGRFTKNVRSVQKSFAVAAVGGGSGSLYLPKTGDETMASSDSRDPTGTPYIARPTCLTRRIWYSVG